MITKIQKKKGVIYVFAWNRHVDAILGCNHADEINKLEILLPINHIYIYILNSNHNIYTINHSLVLWWVPFYLIFKIKDLVLSCLS